MVEYINTDNKCIQILSKLRIIITINIKFSHSNIGSPDGETSAYDRKSTEVPSRPAF